jgi:formylglycine-generating enzyme required for sulfatase activity
MLANVGPSLWPVRLTVKAVGDLNLSTEFASLSLAGTVVAPSLFQTGANDCPAVPDQATVIIPSAQWNELVASSPGGDMAVSIVGNSLVSATQCPAGFSEVVATFTVSPDCNQNGAFDYCDIATGAADDNQNCTPDACEYARGDFGLDGAVSGKDLGYVLAVWGTADPFADTNGDGTVNGADLGTVLSNWGPTPFGAGCLGVPAWATLVEFFPNPAVVTDPALRAAIISTGRPWRVRDTATQVEMLLVPPGTFQMGCIMGSNQYGCYGGELPVHQVTLTNAFYLGRYEVTQSQWVAKMGSNPSHFVAGNGYPGSDARPVEQVSWNTIQGYLSATGFRLPTEAEWEFACRAGTQTPFYNGSSDDNTVGTLAWYSPNSSSQTRPVGGKAANAFGFNDMLGNVWEWVNDWYGNYTTAAQTNPTGPVNWTHRVVRGGSWGSAAANVRSSYRGFFTPGYTRYDIGFRVARTP